MIRVIIVDDELKSIENLIWELGSFKDDIIVTQTFTEPKEAISFLKTNSIDAIFLDIEMPSMNGFTFLDKVKSNDFAIIFTTAYGEHALKAIRKGAYDYLLKPISNSQLKEAIERIKQRKSSAINIDAFEDFLLDYNNNQTKKKIAVHTDGCLTFIEVQKIIYAETDGSYTRLTIENQKDIFLSKNLKDVTSMLDTKLFYRTHNSYVVNLQKIKKFFKTEAYLIMDNNKKIPVARHKKNELLNHF
ncbi:LytR/AlgR family response regulator transcription factor [Tenacibaculum piscium]|uniref:LytT n=2 Tax=Tenacibaculum piscium TaxID=1458515 RepID=A0A2H1YI89_9FLAO|nr:LytTR family DNA-binding domain-containing protein [Tenacibaculum piscium]MBE7629797.1 response regulator [Tenacibaculum piscium]MBE7670209.1 response regulator [Tenacibaculum piscium]SOS75193.1 LytT [Tenacibaculum piscium]